MMKKLTVSLLALLAGIILAQEALSASTTCEKGKITADATEFKYVAPDTATVSFTVETTNKNSQKAVELNNEKTSTLISVIKNSLKENEAIKTSTYNLRQKYEYNSITKKNVADGYIVTNTVTVKLKDTQKTGKIIDLATKNGATSVSGLSFTLQNTDAVCKELTQKAILKAKQQAQDVLAPLGKTIGSIANINYSCSTNTPSLYQYRNFAMAKSAEGAADSSISIEQGETRVNANVSIVFTIK